MNRLDELIRKKEQLEIEVKQLEAQKSLSENFQKNKARKERTRRLIQKGALLEKYFDISHLSVEETEKCLSYFSAYAKGNMPDKFKGG